MASGMFCHAVWGTGKGTKRVLEKGCARPFKGLEEICVCVCLCVLYVFMYASVNLSQQIQRAFGSSKAQVL